MKLYGLTGGIGSGKSEVARCFITRGIPVIDADTTGHTLLKPGGQGEQDVLEAFGEDILRDGHIDRDKLAAVIFADPGERQRLNGILHPLIAAEIAHQSAALAQKGHQAVLVEAALLAEHGKREAWLDGLIVVTCSVEIRCSRLMQSRGMAAEEAIQRMAAQTPPEDKMPLADWVIDNEGSLDALEHEVDRVGAAIRETFTSDK